MNGFEPLIAERAATDRFRAAGVPVARATPTYVRHKPGETTIVAYCFEVPGGEDTHGYAQWCARAARADEIYAKALTMRPRRSNLGQGLVRVDDHTVLYLLPNDARLRRLRWYSEPRKLKRSLCGLVAIDERVSGSRTRVRVLRYKPERRIVNQLSLGTAAGRTRQLLLRYSTRPHAASIHRVAYYLRSHGVPVPEPVAQFERGRVSVDEWLPGGVLLDAVEAGAISTELFVHELRRFHRTPVPSHVPRRTATDELARVTGGLTGLASWCPQVDGLARNVAKVLAARRPFEPEAPNLIHGDLHGKNVMVDGDAISFIDLERVAVGSVAIDLGFLRAHALAQPVRAKTTSDRAPEFADLVLDAYRCHGSRVSDHQIAWHTAVGLVDQALLVARHLEPNYERTTTELLSLAGTELMAPTS